MLRLALLLVTLVLCSTDSADSVADPKSELEAMYDTDQKLRGQLQEMMVKAGGQSEQTLELWNGEPLSEYAKLFGFEYQPR